MEYDSSLDCWIVSVGSDIIGWHTKGLVLKNPDGTVVMLINDRLSPSARKETYEHERAHILNGDLWSEKPAHEIEGVLKWLRHYI